MAYTFTVTATNAAGTGAASAASAAVTPVAPITSAAITVVEPATGDVPATTATTVETGYACGTVTWTPGDNPFLVYTQYTASVTLTADAAYTFPTGFAATINGQTATVTANTGATVMLSYQFPQTAPLYTLTVTTVADGTATDGGHYAEGVSVTLTACTSSRRPRLASRLSWR
jgi:hypothetical protein